MQILPLEKPNEDNTENRFSNHSMNPIMKQVSFFTNTLSLDAKIAFMHLIVHCITFLFFFFFYVLE